MSNAQKEPLTVKLSDVPRGSRGTSSDYLTADCQERDAQGNCVHYTHHTDTPGSDEGDFSAV
jgi:hypothetical protein